MNNCATEVLVEAFAEAFSQENAKDAQEKLQQIARETLGTNPSLDAVMDFCENLLDYIGFNELAILYENPALSFIINWVDISDVAENVVKNALSPKDSIYKDLLAKAKALTEGESDTVAKMANVAALLHQGLNFWWTGFYRVIGGELVLGPFQGPVACIRIPYGKGVCGTAWKEARTIVVPDVEKFPGHIACSSESRSEIVVPVRGASGEITAVLDIDSAELSTFDDVDARWLEEIAGCL